MPKGKTYNARKMTKTSRKGTPQEATRNNHSDFAASEDSFEMVNSSPPSDFEKNDNELEDGYPQDFSGEMSMLLERFSTDINKTMQAKRKKLEQFTQESTRATTKKVLEINKNQSVERRKLVDSFQSQFLAVLQQGERELEKMKEAEDSLQKFLVQQQKHQQQVRIAHNQRMKALKNLSEEFCKGMNELEDSHAEQYCSVHDELRKEMAMLQKKILMETQQQEMMNVRKHLKQLLA